MILDLRHKFSSTGEQVDNEEHHEAVGSKKVCLNFSLQYSFCLQVLSPILSRFKIMLYATELETAGMSTI